MKDNYLLRNLRKHVQRQHLQVLALVVFLCSFLVLSCNVYTHLSHKQQIEEIVYTPQEYVSTSVFATASRPTKLSIPSIDLEASFEDPLSLDESGALNVPKAYDTVGWYEHSPTPGELGPSVIIGHVDSYTGPAVFFSLGQVSEGDLINIEREDGSTVVFEILGFERVEQAEFPLEKVYGAIEYAGIRLITCTGIYDKGEQRYSHNLIVYGIFVEINNKAIDNN